MKNHTRSKVYLNCVSIALLLLSTTSAFAWGERGHNTVGQVAAFLVADYAANESEKALIGQFFRERALAFGHLNNIPDISWKNSAYKSANKLNNQTHYLDLDSLFPKPSLPETLSLPKSFAELKKRFPEIKFSKVGSAPWRIEELFGKSVKAGPAIKNETSALDYQILLGVMGHFVADLSQPYHTTEDYDGWKTKQGGIHAYFETDLVEALAPQLLDQVLTSAKNQIKSIDLKQQDPFILSLQLAQSSFEQIDKVRALDKKIALVEESKGKKIAVRKDPNLTKVNSAFQEIIVQRLGLGAVYLARIWYLSWVKSGRPDLSSIQKYKAPYPLDVPFMVPGYLK